MLLAIVWTGCEGTLPTEPVSPTTGEEPGENTGTSPPPEGTDDTDLAAPPTEVDAACWSWAAAFMTLNIGEGADDLIYTRLRTYDPATLALLSLTSDRDADGVADEVTTYTWDAAFAHVLQQRDDEDANGEADTLAEWTYDEDDNVTSLKFDLQNDGGWEEVWTYTYAGGLRLTDEQDVGDDGTVDTVVTYFYDAERLAWYERDDGVDGTIDTLATYSYLDGLEPSVTRTIDVGVDGAIEETMTWTYDAEGRLVHTLFTNSDGSEVTYAYTYNDDGDVETLGAVIAHPNSYSRWTTAYTYEAPRRLLLESTEFFSDEDGTDPTLLSHVDYVWSCP